MFPHKSPSIRKVLVGTKSDLPRAVERAVAESWAEMHKIPYFEASSKLGDGVNEPFLFLAREVCARIIHI